ncbi:MAG: glutathione S-transferase family protein [Pseudomonadota bacterium]
MRLLLLIVLSPLLVVSLPALIALFIYRGRRYRRKSGRQSYRVPHEHPLELYFMPLSLCSSKVLFALKSAGAEVHLKEVDIGHFGRFQQLEASFLKLNPNACVPVLVHDGWPVLESDEILAYLADTLVPGSLKPSAEDPAAVKAMHYWTERGGFVDMRGAMSRQAGAAVAALSAPLFAIDHQYMRLPTLLGALLKHPQPQIVALKIANWFLGAVKPPPRMIDEAFETLTDCFSDMETRLSAGGDWLSGHVFTLADVTWAANLARLDLLGALAFFLDERPAVQAYWSRLRARPGFADAFSDPLTQSAEFLQLQRVAGKARAHCESNGVAQAYGWKPA